jgi:hypothetical protein
MRRSPVVCLFAALVAIFVFGAVTAEAQMVATRSTAIQILIPAAGSVTGANDTFFRSDVTLLNYRNASQRVRIQWMPQSVSGLSVAATELTMNPLSGINSEDFVGSVLHQSGLGAMLITALTAGGAPDTAAQLMATSRIWTPQAGTTGYASQQFNGVPVADINSTVLTMVGHRRDERFRTNVGVVNLDSASQTFRIDVRTSEGTTESQSVDVPALSMVQTGLLGPSSAGPLQILVTNTGLPPHTASFLSYASTIDNVTGDAWSTLGFNQPATPTPPQ